MSEFTKGPWVKNGLEIWAGKSNIADAWRGYHDDDGQFSDISAEEAEANTLLIAAAPDMYEALSELVRLLGVKFDHNFDCNQDILDRANAWDRAKAALAKARGGE